MRRCFQARAIVESLQLSGIEQIVLTYHHERIDAGGFVVGYQPLDIPPTMHYCRAGSGWFEVIEQGSLGRQRFVTLK